MDNSLYKKSKISVLKFLQANLFFFRIPTPENNGKLNKRQKRLESNIHWLLQTKSTIQRINIQEVYW